MRAIRGDRQVQCDVLVALSECRNHRTWFADFAKPYLGDHPVEIGSGLVDYAREWIPLVCPAFPFAMSPVDIATGHVRRYTKRSMTKAMTDAGLEPVEVRYANSLGLICYYAFTSLLRGQPSTGGTMMIYDRLVVPVVRFAERMMRDRPPFGQSVIAVARVKSHDAAPEDLQEG
jgi:hypothetical protein